MAVCLGVIGGAGTPNIIWYLSKEPRCFSDLKSDVQGISSKVLTQRLRKLEDDGIVLRKVMPTSPPTVEYRLTEIGKELKPAIEAIADVGRRLKEIRGEERGIFEWSVTSRVGKIRLLGSWAGITKKPGMFPWPGFWVNCLFVSLRRGS